MEFHGPLSVQEDWIRHLQQHILKMNYNKPAAAPEAPARASDPEPAPEAPAEPAAILKVPEEQPAPVPTPLPLPTQSA